MTNEILKAAEALDVPKEQLLEIMASAQSANGFGLIFGFVIAITCVSIMVYLYRLMSKDWDENDRFYCTAPLAILCIFTFALTFLVTPYVFKSIFCPEYSALMEIVDEKENKVQ